MSAKVKVVTGYVPIPTSPRTAKEYGELGEKLRELKTPIHPFYNTLAECWLQRYIDRNRLTPGWAVADNSKKNSLAYHIVNHQKFEWLVHAAAQDNRPDTFVWIDYGIHHVPEVNTEVIECFLGGIKKDDLAIPGCWSATNAWCQNVGDEYPNWRFCGGVMVVPRAMVFPLFVGVRKQVKVHLDLTNRVTFEVNTLASVERGTQLPIRWYQADHNETLFTNYGVDLDQSSAGLARNTVSAPSDRLLF